MGSTEERSYVEPFNTRFRDELLDGAIFAAFAEAEIVV